MLTWRDKLQVADGLLCLGSMDGLKAGQLPLQQIYMQLFHIMHRLID
jgi:hypothetical protein